VNTDFLKKLSDDDLLELLEAITYALNVRFFCLILRMTASLI